MNALQALEQIPAAERKLLITVAGDALHGTLTVADTGPGIAPDVLPRLFEPFFTTRTGGLGLGLNLCETLAQTDGRPFGRRSKPTPGSRHQADSTATCRAVTARQRALARSIVGRPLPVDRNDTRELSGVRRRQIELARRRNCRRGPPWHPPVAVRRFGAGTGRCPDKSLQSGLAHPDTSSAPLCDRQCQ